ncbi:MAG: ATP-binding protein, partial [Ignavibacteriaceae bacterium]|nr:ATP-binding protein [Ignavibacteriaceae bacterium]
MIQEKTFTLKNDISELNSLREFSEVFGQENKISNDIINKFQLAFEELISNIIFYGYDDELPHQIDVVFTLDGKSMAVRIVDDAKEFNPLAKEDPDISLSIDERKIGGLGIYLVKSLMDEVNYKRESGKNYFYIKKYF